VLELGCGLGIASLVALRAGYTVIASDYEPDALAFVAESARQAGLPAPRTCPLDWRQTYPELRPDRIVAAEVLYEARNLRPIAEFVRAHLAPGGLALISDADRPTADEFPRVARQQGLIATVAAAQRPADAWFGPVSGRIFQLTHAG
jgi:cyclopropane fatty-acyl-phospholipid synthase-like methyltransferase